MSTQLKIVETIDGYVITWGDPYNIRARVSRLRTAGDGQVKGELEISQGEGPDERILVVPTQFNFSSERTRVSFAKDLKAKLSQEIEWKEVFDGLALTVQGLVRRGEDCVEVYPDDEIVAPEQLVYGLIYKGVQNIIFGEKGVNKSTLAYMLGIICTLPWYDNPLGLRAPDRPIKVLVLDWETDLRLFRYYMTRLHLGMNIPACSLHYRRCIAPLADDIAPIQHKIETTGAEILIIDSLGAAAGGERGELKGEESALSFNRGLWKLRTTKGEPLTSLIIGQTAKGKEKGKSKSVFGSAFFTYYSRNIFELALGDYDYSDTLHLALFHRECNLGRKLPPIGIRVKYDDDTKALAMSRETPMLSDYSDRVGLNARICEHLKKGKARPKDMKEELDVSYAALSMALKRLMQQGKVYKQDKDYVLAHPDETRDFQRHE